MLSGVPVLNYHRLLPDCPASCSSRPTRFSISSRQFTHQLQQIRDLGAQSYLLEDLWRNGHSCGKARSVVLSFDDGRDSDYHIAYPQLLESGILAEFFVNTATIGTRGFLSWAQISEMQRSGMSFQSHSHDHTDLTRLSTSELKKQLQYSKHLLEDRTGLPVHFLAVPYSRVNTRVVTEACEAGYWAVCRSGYWPASPCKILLSRIPVYGHTSIKEFRALLLLRASCYAARATRSALSYIRKHLLLAFWPGWVSKWREQHE